MVYTVAIHLRVVNFHWVPQKLDKYRLISLYACLIIKFVPHYPLYFQIIRLSDYIISWLNTMKLKASVRTISFLLSCYGLFLNYGAKARQVETRVQRGKAGQSRAFPTKGQTAALSGPIDQLKTTVGRRGERRAINLDVGHRHREQTLAKTAVIAAATELGSTGSWLT